MRRTLIVLSVGLMGLGCGSSRPLYGTAGYRVYDDYAIFHSFVIHQ